MEQISRETQSKIPPTKNPNQKPDSPMRANQFTIQMKSMIRLSSPNTTRAMWKSICLIKYHKKLVLIMRLQSFCSLMN
jgi:hypothetical protein